MEVSIFQTCGLLDQRAPRHGEAKRSQGPLQDGLHHLLLARHWQPLAMELFHRR